MTKTESNKFSKEKFERKLSDTDRDIFLKMSEESPEPNEALKKAAAEYNKRIKDGNYYFSN